jgi:putative ABC transport system substrate-binding protein
MEPLLKFATKFNIPVAGANTKIGDVSTVIEVLNGHVEIGKQAAILADKILKGAHASSIPVVTPENLVIIDYQMAEKIGLPIPEGILRQADNIIR